jgi:CRISPR-associated exonuclease Cas4
MHVNLGLDYHTAQEKLSKNRKFNKLNIKHNEIILNKYIENEDLNINGIVDLYLVGDSEVIPIEFKDIENKKPSYGYILQLVGYGILLENRYKKSFKQAFIIYSNNMKLFHINITEQMKQDFFKTIKEIEKIVDNQIFPNSSANERQCSQCEYLNYCDDRF